MDNSKTKKHVFAVKGMHCGACVLLTESELGDLPNITHVKSSLENESIEVVGDFGDKTEEQIARDLTAPLISHGYSVAVGKSAIEKRWDDFIIAIPVSLAFVALFLLLQKIGIVNIIDSSNMTYGTVFVIGIIASLSTCMAVVGGLVLSMSATFAKEGSKLQPQLMFHGGRIASFFVLGGIIGSIGTAFTLNTSATFILNLIIGIVMLILGINLLDVFSFAKKLQPSMPKSISRYAYGVSKFNHTLTPLLVGVATFFLPCGFTQSMQLYTLGTGGFLKGGLTMLIFALGTLPVLSVVSFSSFGIKNAKMSGVFFKSAGLIVIMFALFNIINGLVVINVLPPIFNL